MRLQEFDSFFYWEGGFWDWGFKNGPRAGFGIQGADFSFDEAKFVCFEIYESVFTLARTKNAHIYIPSGAVAGIDGLEAAMTGGVNSVMLTTRKPREALADSPYVTQKGLRLAEFTGDTVIFEGSAREAIKAFPFNINVAVTLSFAGLGLDQTHVRIITGPGITTNTHEVEVVGSFGRMVTRTENIPSPQNPKTSYLAVLSACAMLNEILNPVKIGT